MNQYQINVDLTNDPNINKVITSGLRQFNESKIGSYEIKPFTIYLSKGKQVMGGLKGEVFDKLCSVQTVWLDETERSKGWGRKLFDELTHFAQSQQCAFIQLDTAEFQARSFYENIGFRVVATLPNNFKGHTTYILRKAVDDQKIIKKR